MSVVYGAGTIRRQRRTKGEVEQLERQILDVLRLDHPQSVRHVFYRLTDPRLPEPVPKTELGYRVVQNRLTLMRRESKVPYGWISDATRRGYHTRTYANGADFLRRHIGAYRADLWSESEFYVEVWCESRSIAGVIEDECEELAVSLYPCGGFSSITFAYEASQLMRFECNAREQHSWPWIDGEEPEDAGENIFIGCAQSKIAVVIYIGDYDPAGVLIDRSLETELRKHLPRGFLLYCHRIAITPEQIEEYDLPTKPRKETDRRALHVLDTVEAEAIPVGVLHQMLREKVESFLPAGSLEVAKTAEESEREHLRRWADLMDGEAAP
jgi:hypothetical protein